MEIIDEVREMDYSDSESTLSENELLFAFLNAQPAPTRAND